MTLLETRIGKVAVFFALAAIAGLGASRPAEAMVFSTCEAPEIIQSDVNVVIIPYALNSDGLRLRHDSFALWESEGAGAISTLMQFDTIFSLGYPASLAVVQLRSEGEECSIERIKRDVLGQMEDGKGAVFLWGGLIDLDGEIFVQSYIEFVRKNRTTDVAISLSNFSDHTPFFGRLPQSGLGLPPRIFTVEDLVRIFVAVDATTTISSEPRGPGDVQIPREWSDPFTIYVTQRDDDGWMRVESTTGLSGWVPARPEWSLRSMLPDLELVDAAVGFLVAQILREENSRERLGDSRQTFYDVTASQAMQALDRFIEGIGSDALDQDPDTTAALSLARAMKGILILNSPLNQDDLSNASSQFREAAAHFKDSIELTPYQADTRNLLGIAESAMASTGQDEIAASLAFKEWMRALSLEPDNELVAANLATYFRALMDMQQLDRVGLTEDEAAEKLRILEP